MTSDKPERKEMSKPLRVLIVEDSEDDTMLLLLALRRGGYEPVFERVESAESMRSTLEQKQWDLVISDYVLPQFSAPAALNLLKESGVDLPFIIVSGNIGEDIAVEAMKAGAHDYIIKGNLRRLVPAVDRELREAEGRRDHNRLKEIKKEKEFIDAVLNNVEMLVIVLDPAGKILSLNRAFETLTSYSFSEVKDRPFWDIFLTPDEVETIKTLFRELLAGISPNRHKHYWLTKSGGRKFIEWTYSIIRSAGGSVRYVIGTGIDATDRKQAEEALRDSEERFRLIAETSSDVIFQTDLQGRITYCSPAVSKFGYSADSTLGSFFGSYLPKTELPKAAAAFERVTSGERIDLLELELLRADGSLFQGELSISPVMRQGHITGIQGIARDITSRKEAAWELKKARDEAMNGKNRLEAIMEALPVGVAFLDARGGHIRSNSAFEKIWGCPRPAPRDVSEYASHKAWWVETGEPVRPEEWASARAVMHGEAVTGQLMQIERFDNTRAFILNSAAPIFDSDGRITGCAVAILDVSDRIEAEEALKVSEIKYRSLFTRMIDGFALHKILLDDTGKPVDYVFLEVNSAFERLTGLRADDIIGKRVTEVLPGIENDPADWIGAYGIVALSGKELRFEQHSAPLDKWYSIAAFSPMWAFFVTIFEDISSRKKAEQALREHEQDLKRAQAVGHIGSWRLDIGRNELRWSDENHRIFGVSSGTPLTYETFLSIVHPADRQYVDNKWNAALQGQPYDIEHRIVVDDKVKWVREKAELEFDETGILLGGFGTTQDITEKKQTEEELRMATEELELRILERTADLTKANEDLAAEVAERKEAEQRITSTNELLKLFSQSLLRKEYLDEVVSLLNKWCSCDGVGIRLTDEDGNISYASCSGFSSEFRDKENCLSIGEDDCVCPRIIAQKPDPPEARHMTPAGSFFCNDMERFISAMAKDERARYRGTCSAFGFSSLATVPVRYRNNVLGAIHLADRRRDKVPLKLIQFIESLSPLIGEALYRFYIEEALMSSRAQLRNLSMHLQAAREEERTKVAREIHDELGQILTAASMELSRIMLKKTSQKSVDALVLSASELIDSAIQDIQRICSELRPRVLDHLGLVPAIEWQAKKFTEHAGIRCTLDMVSSPADLPETMSTALFRIFQETLTNVARHANATEVTVHMGVADGSLVLEVKDNGRGFVKKKIFGEDSFGIMGIRERVHDLGGNVSFTSVRNKGTTVTVKVPLLKGGA